MRRPSRILGSAAAEAARPNEPCGLGPGRVPTCSAAPVWSRVTARQGDCSSARRGRQGLGGRPRREASGAASLRPPSMRGRRRPRALCGPAMPRNPGADGGCHATWACVQVAKSRPVAAGAAAPPALPPSMPLATNRLLTYAGWRVRRPQAGRRRRAERAVAAMWPTGRRRRRRRAVKKTLRPRRPTMGRRRRGGGGMAMQGRLPLPLRGQTRGRRASGRRPSGRRRGRRPSACKCIFLRPLCELPRDRPCPGRRIRTSVPSRCTRRGRGRAGMP